MHQEERLKGYLLVLKNNEGVSPGRLKKQLVRVKDFRDHGFSSRADSEFVLT